MNPEDVVLVALVNDPGDLERVEREHWYRIPVRHAPRFFSGAQYVAFYLARAFGERKWAIHEYAEVRGHELVRRRDLIPEQSDHPRADELYFKLQLGPLLRREPAIVSKRPRRILFLWTTWARFSTAGELNDLIAGTPAQDKLWEALKSANLDAEREPIVREGESRYRLDFLVHCPRGRLGIQIGRGDSRLRKGRHFRLMSIAEEDLEDHFERSLDRVREQARELGYEYVTEEEKA